MRLSFPHSNSEGSYLPRRIDPSREGHELPAAVPHVRTQDRLSSPFLLSFAARSLVRRLQVAGCRSQIAFLRRRRGVA